MIQKEKWQRMRRAARIHMITRDLLITCHAFTTRPYWNAWRHPNHRLSLRYAYASLTFYPMERQLWGLADVISFLHFDSVTVRVSQTRWKLFFVIFL